MISLKNESSKINFQILYTKFLKDITIDDVMSSMKKGLKSDLLLQKVAA